MMTQRFFTWVATALMGAALVFIWPSEAQAQRRGGGGGGGGGWNGGGYRGGGWGGNNSWLNYVPGINNYGYNNYGYGYNNGPYNRGYYQGNRSYYGPGYNAYYPSTGTYYEAAPAYSAAPVQTYAVDPNRTATIEIRVTDPNATIMVDGHNIAQSGMVRTFTTPPIEPGFNYSYQIRAQSSDGRMQEKTVTFRAGERTMVDFTQPTATPAATTNPENIAPPALNNNRPLPNQQPRPQQPAPEQSTNPTPAP